MLICPHFGRWWLLTTFACVAMASVCVAQSDAPATATSWELTPYRVQIGVVVEPSARLVPGFEVELQKQLLAQAEATFGGPWLVSAWTEQPVSRGRLLRQLADPDETVTLPGKPNADKLLVVSLREVEGRFQIVAREYSVLIGLWNMPVPRSTDQVQRISAEAFTALRAAWAPLLRIDSVDKDSAAVTLRAGSLPKRDGNYLSVDPQAAFGVYLVQTDKSGAPVPQGMTPVPWTFLLPLAISSSSSPGSRATFKCRLQTAVSGTPIPEFHPLLLRLGSAIPKTSASSRLLLVDQQEPHAPLEGYEVFYAAIEGLTASTALQKVGVTGRNGELELPAGDGSLRRLIVKHGGEELASRPYVPGLRSEVKLRLPSNRLRLELAAELAAAEDELIDTVGRFTVLTARLQDGVVKRDIAGVGRTRQELKSVSAMGTLTNRLAALDSRLAAADDATRARLGPAVDRLKKEVESLQAQAAKIP